VLEERMRREEAEERMRRDRLMRHTQWSSRAVAVSSSFSLVPRLLILILLRRPGAARALCCCCGGAGRRRAGVLVLACDREGENV
jgi:hypothetical protein